MFRKTLVLLLSAGLLAGIVGAGSALFTDSDPIDANAFSAGSVILATDPTTALVTYSNMAPGDVDIAPVVVSNNGSLALRYAVTSVTTDADNKHLDAQLDLTVALVTTVACSAETFDVVVEPAYTPTIVYATGDLGDVEPGIDIIGDPTTGADAGDRTLTPTSEETLCFKVVLPLGSGDAYQAATTTATFTFASEQTANN
ncbi:MAG: TasA family protein [Chloroflexota bacterium]